MINGGKIKTKKTPPKLNAGRASTNEKGII
jgi:hypothetical protein